jgi:putative N6-adenine-specific DNA methylase
MTRTTHVVKRKSKAQGPLKLFATTEAGLEENLVAELKKIGARGIVKAVRGAAFTGDLTTVYKANLWLRTAGRVLIELAVFEAPNREALYEGARRIPWQDHLSLNNTLAVDAVSNRSKMNHTQFISQVVKDAIVDNFRSRTGKRPNVDSKNPDLKINARLLEDRCTLSVDTSGQRLHRRGYRPLFGVVAPLKENLAAGILLQSGYDGSRPLVDPMCGSGTLLIEGALIARNIAPGLLGRSFGFTHHPSFDKRLWQNVVAEAKAASIKDAPCVISGSDISQDAIRTAMAAVQGAGMDDSIRLRKADFTDLRAHSGGLVVTNPPFGERLGEIEQLADLYADLGNVLKRRCVGMTAHILTSSKFLSGRIGLRPKRRSMLWNGAMECRLLHFEIY